jgi:hypothetical protein
MVNFIVEHVGEPLEEDLRQDVVFELTGPCIKT